MVHYLDCNATTPLDPEVADVVMRYSIEEYGNAGSRTHSFGARAKSAIENARQQVADVIDADPSEVIFTSGATESNNIALLGLAKHLLSTGKNHIITSSIEHKAVLEPIARLESLGCKVEFIDPSVKGEIHPKSILGRVTENTGLISLMHVNNETGMINDIEEIANQLNRADIFFHVDAAQSFAKVLPPLKHSRIDLISISGHKIYAPKGVGALVLRRRNYKSPPLEPILLGGGQERGLRPGTLPVSLIAGLGEACRLLVARNREWHNACNLIRTEAIDAFQGLDYHLNGNLDFCLPNVLNISVTGINSETAMLILKSTAAISNGSACTSTNYTLSHVLSKMGLEEDRIKSALRLSWSDKHLDIPWQDIVNRLKSVL